MCFMAKNEAKNISIGGINRNGVSNPRMNYTSSQKYYEKPKSPTKPKYNNLLGTEEYYDNSSILNDKLGLNR